MQHTHHLLLWARRLAGDRLPSGGGIRCHPKMDRKRVRLKSCTLHTMGANTPVCSVFHGKGHNFPFPHFTQSVPPALHGCVTVLSCGSGLVFPHPAEHTGTLTPPIVRRTSVSHSAKGRCAQAAAPPAHRHFGQGQELPRGRIGRGSPPPHATPHGPINKGYALSQQPTDNPHPQFPDALMARHNAGGRGVWSGAVPASVSSVRCSRSKGPSARLLIPTAYHTGRHGVKRHAPAVHILRAQGMGGSVSPAHRFIL